MVRGADLAVFAFLVVLGLVLYWAVFDIPPFDDDNLYALAWVDAAPVGAVFAVDPAIYPEWRPLAYASLWLEHRLVQSGPVAIHFAVNLALWIACAWLVYRSVHLLAQSRIAALMSATMVLTDPRATWALVSIIERQTTMACAFGLAALLVVLRADQGRLSWPRGLAVMFLLLGSALSKEYGLAFALAMVGFAGVGKRADLGWPALAACAAYGALRVATTGGAAGSYCEEMYFFFDVRNRCIDLAQPSSFPQMAYNVAATVVNLSLPGLLSGEGRPLLAEARLATGTVFLSLAVVGLVRGPALVRLIAIVPIANGLLSFMIYRDRNQLAGACALAIVSGVGFAGGDRLLRSRTVRVAAGAVIVALLGAQAVLAFALTNEQRAHARAIEPCASDLRARPFVPPFIARVKSTYAMNDPGCRGAY